MTKDLLRAYEFVTQYYDPHYTIEKLYVLYREGTAKAIIEIHETSDLIYFLKLKHSNV
jgi:hypothetical protein